MHEKYDPPTCEQEPFGDRCTKQALLTNISPDLREPRQRLGSGGTGTKSRLRLRRRVPPKRNQDRASIDDAVSVSCLTASLTPAACPCWC